MTLPGEMIEVLLQGKFMTLPEEKVMILPQGKFMNLPGEVTEILPQGKTMIIMKERIVPGEVTIGNITAEMTGNLMTLVIIPEYIVTMMRGELTKKVDIMMKRRGDPLVDRCLD